jgi:hypothetical protein
VRERESLGELDRERREVVVKVAAKVGLGLRKGSLG